MLNEFAYCPGLGCLEWVQGQFADSDDTTEGRYRHRNVDRARQRSRRPDDGEAECPKIDAFGVAGIRNPRAERPSSRADRAPLRRVTHEAAADR